MWDRRTAQLDYEMNVFIDHIQKNVDSLEELEKGTA
jgi:phosphatidylserine/phosphatidylglycerophosphate/cardiolipin synthase-like enzyme